MGQRLWIGKLRTPYVSAGFEDRDSERLFWHILGWKHCKKMKIPDSDSARPTQTFHIPIRLHMIKLGAFSK